MHTAHLRGQQQRNRPGIVLLAMLLLVIVLGVVVYFFGIYPEDRKTRRLQEQSPEIYPWVEEWRIEHLGRPRPRGHERRELSDEQPHITEYTNFVAHVRQGDEQVDMMYFMIVPDGTVRGNWSGNFETISPRMHYIINANFKGNIDPSKIYSDEDGEDPSKLYFITRGKYLTLETNYETNKVRKINGQIYVVGWLSSEFTAFGQIHMTPNKKTQRIYKWTAVGKTGF